MPARRVASTTRPIWASTRARASIVSGLSSPVAWPAPSMSSQYIASRSGTSGTVTALPAELTGRPSRIATASSPRRSQVPPGWVYSAPGSPYVTPRFCRMNHCTEATLRPAVTSVSARVGVAIARDWPRAIPAAGSK
ncbi:hypothetical protein VTA80_01380 [Pengzhenrongella phosphoraccumulans]